MKHLRLFKDNASYDLYKNSDNFVLPNVSHVIDTKKTCYNPLIKEKPIVLRATYNAVDDGENGMRCYSNNNNIKSVKIDNVNPFKDAIEVEHNNTYELNDSNIVINWDEWTAECPDEVMFNGRVNSLSLTPKDSSIVLSQEAFDNGEILIGYIFTDEYDNKGIYISNVSPDEWNFDASSNSISLNEDLWFYYDYALFLVKYTNDMDFPEIIDTVSVVNYTTGGMSMDYSFETEGVHEVEFVLKDNFIGDETFSDCTSLTSITIPNSVTSIGDSAFSNCSALTAITIPDSVTSIGVVAFSGCTSLTSITIPNSVTSIGDQAFRDCTSLTSVIIGNSVEIIGDSAFNNCNSLINIVVSEGNTTFDSRNNCNAIIESETNTLIYGCKNTIIPDSVTSIGRYAFCDCTSLTSVIIPDSVTSIEIGAFRRCTSLTSVIIPDSVTSIGEEIFCECTSLTSVNIGNSVTSIGRDTFGHCSALTEITIGNSVETIGDHAFFYCSNLTTIYCKAVTPPTLVSNAIPSNVTTIYVPEASVEAYKAATFWSNYANKIQGYNF